ncbi:MerR family transcriptional regulator [Streptomyces sp. Ru87]|uniref:MerR family transcriptional regulator n=1 Tax=Streptomyces sp. Ru87 TaxID=2044307 RepID=UPI000BF54085|nr:MerR family transcriptional regulator [Streptomyces sp. Ru87]PGH47930.1 MerR family transcriptional regulator [Streptomyces sp. Ru87]
MELVGIGEAARITGVNASALRYYEERGLVRPAERRSGRRMYGREQLRRLVFLQLMQRVGMSLDAAGAVLDDPGEQWRAAVREQLDALDELVARARAAQHFLGHALRCPADHPAQECPYMTETLDRRIDGTSFEDLAAEHGHTAPVPPGGPPPFGWQRHVPAAGSGGRN